MKTVNNFMVGTASTFGVNESIQGIESLNDLPPNIIDSVEALVSLLGGILSAIIVAWLKRKWDRKDKEKAI